MTTPETTPDARALALLLRLAAAQERGETCIWSLYQQIEMDYGVTRARADAIVARLRAVVREEAQ